LIGVIVALLLVTVMILAALKVRNERRAQRPGDLPLKKATAPSSEDLYDADDRNPDVVPTNKGKAFIALIALCVPGNPFRRETKARRSIIVIISPVFFFFFSSFK